MRRTSFKPGKYRTNKHYPKKGWWYPVGGFSQFLLKYNNKYYPPINWKVYRYPHEIERKGN